MKSNERKWSQPAKIGQPSVVATIQNPTMDAIDNLVYDAKIVKKDTKEEVFKRTYDSQMELAPNSTYPFAIEYGNQQLVPGEYILDLMIKDAKEKKWTFKEEFIISNQQAKNINQTTVNKGKESLNYLLYGIILIIFICLVVGYWVWIKK